MGVKISFGALFLKVRAAGMGIAVALTMTESGRITMTTQCQHIVGGPWGAAFNILLDQSECSLVRQQAVLLLINLTSQKLPSGNFSSSSDVLYGPIVRNEDTQVMISVMHVPALASPTKEAQKCVHKTQSVAPCRENGCP